MRIGFLVVIGLFFACLAIISVLSTADYDACVATGNYSAQTCAHIAE